MLETSPPSSAPDPIDPALARAERRMARMGRVADLALELAEAAQARALEALAAAPDPETPKNRTGELVAAFDRAARAVRLCCTLEARFEEELAPRRETAARAAETRAKAQAAAREHERLARRTPAQVRRDDLKTHIGEAIDIEAESGRDARLLEAALDERLERDGERLLDGPFGAVMARLCDDLGLDPDWSQWEELDWAIEETRARAEGSPYADWPLPGEPEPDHDAQIDAALARRAARLAQAAGAVPDPMARTQALAAEDARLRQAFVNSLGP